MLRALTRVAIWGLASIAAMWLILFAMNQRQGWDARAAYETQDDKLEGRVGVAIVALTMPELVPARTTSYVL